MAGSLLFMRGRQLSSAEVGYCYKIYVDDYYSDNLMILNFYDNGLISSRSYDVYSFAYGNLASTIKVIPPVTPPYLKFTPSLTFSSTLSSDSSFLWLFMQSSSTATSSTL